MEALAIRRESAIACHDRFSGSVASPLASSRAAQLVASRRATSTPSSPEGSNVVTSSASRTLSMRRTALPTTLCVSP
jgi:hypothetical protein